MPKFISPRDVNFFKGIARELVDVVIENVVILFKINIKETRTNLYGEAVSKTWHPGVELNVLINKEPETVEYEKFGANTMQNVEFRFDRWMCEEKNTYPEIGDVLLFNGSYYEINNTSEVQFAGGQPYNNFSIVCSTFMVSKSSLDIEERIN